MSRIQQDVTEFLFLDAPVDYVWHFASPASPVDYLELPIQTLKVGSLGTHKALGLARMARALSCIRGLSYVDPAVVREVAIPVLAHRIIVQTQGTQPEPSAALIQAILLSQHTPQ